ncbi:MAG TPA: O-antigen ligase domain-containing protein [Crocinitomix sp.]|nr:O-antigen ligase domain-containing protein [Crocinitomix sp.]
MIYAYKQNAQFILLLIIMYVVGVWGGPVIYLLFPVVFGLFGLKRLFLEMIITSIWLLILSDYIPIKGATYNDLQFAKDLKPLIPLFLFGFYFLNRDRFPPIPKIFINFIPFLIVALIALKYSIKLDVGIKKYISFVLMYFTIPVYINYLHQKYGTLFWDSLLTFITWMLIIGLVLGIVAPQIGMIGGDRFKGILGNPNGLGIFLNLTFILWTLAREYHLITFNKKENRLVFFVILISLFWSGSRNGIMSIFMFYMVYRLVKIHWSFAIIVVISVVVFEEIIFSAFIEVIQFFQLSDYFRLNSLEEGSGRKKAWIFAWQEIQNYFFIGGGFGHDEHIMRPNYYWLKRIGHDGGVHNSYLSMWFDAGIIGVILYYGALIKVVLTATKIDYIGIAFLVSILFNISYESWLVASLNPYTIIFLIILTIFVQQLRGNQIHKNIEN